MDSYEQSLLWVALFDAAPDDVNDRILGMMEGEG